MATMIFVGIGFVIGFGLSYVVAKSASFMRSCDWRGYIRRYRRT